MAFTGIALPVYFDNIYQFYSKYRVHVVLNVL